MAAVYVTGHRNPDTDSIASAIGYAELKGRLDPRNEYIPVRLGDLNAQTRWVLRRSRAPEPDLLPHVLLRVTDEVLALAREHGTTVVSSRWDSYVSSRMVTLSAPCRALMNSEPLTVRPDDLVADISGLISGVDYRAAVAVDAAHRPVGVVTHA